MDINKTINDLWPIAPEWANFIAVDFDGSVWGYECFPNVNFETDEWKPVERNGLYHHTELTSFYGHFPNWPELIFERPVVTSQPADSESNELTPLLQKLRNYLDTTSRQQIEADWAQVKSLGLTGSPNCEEFIKTFKL